MTSDRRRFSRIPFHSPARLHLPEAEVMVEIIDLSLKGALVHLGPGPYAAIGSNVRLEIGLDRAGDKICMEATLVHRRASQAGLACREIDLDSITHLRRLVELNLGDESILDRELAALLSPDN